MPIKDKDKLKQYQASWYQKNSDLVKTRATAKYSAKTNIKKLVDAARQRSRKKGLTFSITDEDITIPELCPILGKPLVRFTPYAPSIDRIDSTQGYTKDNVWVISRRANLMKNDANVEDLKEFAKWVTKNLTP